MIKKLSLFLISLFTFASATSLMSNAAINNASSVIAEEDDSVLHGYTYTEEEDEDYGVIYRIFDSHDLAPIINQDFHAPMGFNFNLEIGHDQLDEIMEQAEFAGANFQYADIVLRYEYFGSLIYVDSKPLFVNDDIENPKQYLANSYYDYVNNFTIFEVDELSVETTIKVKMEILFSTDDDTYYTLVFWSNPYTFSPFGENDFVSLSAFYYVLEDANEKRVTFRCELVDGFFYESPLYNESGFHTDSVVPYFDEIKENDAFLADVNLTLVAYDSIPLANFDSSHTIEMSFTNEVIPLKVRMTFISGGKEYNYYSKAINFGDPHMSLYIDEYENRTSVERNTSHEFSLHVDYLDVSDILSLYANIDVFPYRLNDNEYGYDLYETRELPEKGREGYYYYLPTNDECELYKAGKYDELNDSPAYGTYYLWDEGKQEFVKLEEIEVLDTSYDKTNDEAQNLNSLLANEVSLPFIGKWVVSYSFYIECTKDSYSVTNNNYLLDAVIGEQIDDTILLNVPDEVNLILGGGNVDIIPTPPNKQDDVEYYFDWDMSKTGIIEIEENIDDVMTIVPLNPGLVNVIITVESRLFSTISKTISIRVMDMEYDRVTITVPDEFHYTNVDLTATLNIRGITHFQNLNVRWQIYDKKGESISEDGFIDNKDASVTLLKPEYNDYTFAVYYDDMFLNSVVVEVRSVDLNKFLRVNIWWIVLTTLIFVAILVLFNHFLKRGRTIVENIEHVYQVYSDCMANNTLSYSELKRIKKEIVKCLHRSENINIDALNQYEKAIRYLKKSLIDTRGLISGFNYLSLEDKSVLTDNLEKDLSKSLTFAKEIEAAREIIEEKYLQANKLNYERIDTPKDKKNKKH